MHPNETKIKIKNRFYLILFDFIFYCNHKFENDVIDYGLDRTKLITYFVYCGETK